MDQCDHSQPQALPPFPHPHYEHVPILIEPCAMFYKKFGGKASDIFHLLSCGHIVATEDHDRRCGRNCQHAFRSLLDYEQTQQVKNHLQLPSLAQAFDILYCEVCSGIPFDRYKILSAMEEHSKLRRSIALTRPLLQTTLGIDFDQVHALLCSPFFNPNCEGFDWNHTHRLRCGHEVWSPILRPCATNCSLEPGCQGARIFTERQGDVIFCHECVSRADLVFHRYERLEQATHGGIKSGHMSMGPQVTLGYEHEDTIFEEDSAFMLL